VTQDTDPPNAYGGWDHDGHPDNEKGLETMKIDATYSPDDNKLRLYASQRLDAETYARVKAAGFSWAPKQGFFVAPMWTPERADLCIELAGDIGDEDTSLAERAESRAERFDDYSGKRAAESAAASKAVRELADGIPLGQPILVGHHSEKHARRDAARIENGMRKAVKLWETSEYWTHRAQAAMDHAAYKERPDVRARRIARIEADRRKVERSIAGHSQRFRLWSNVLSPDSLKRKDGQPSTLRERVLYLANNCHYSQCFPLADFPRDPPASQYEGQMGLWSAVDGNVISPEQARDIALKLYSDDGSRCPRRWLEHYDFRLAYERAMLGAAGGTATDQKRPEVGGAILGSVWGPDRGAWAYIQKVNKVTVSLLHTWNRGSGRVFRQNVPMTDIADASRIMSRAEVEAARAAGRVRDIMEGAKALGFHLIEAQPTEEEKPDNVCPDGAACPETECREERERQGLPVADAAADIEAMRASLKAGVQVATSPTLYPTPRDLAARMVELADIQGTDRVLEPSAGTGALVGAMGGRFHGNDPMTRGHLVAIELNHDLAERLRREFPLTEVHCGDFLDERFSGEALPLFDKIVMNPPFNGGDDIRHILAARKLLRPGGRLVAICAGGPRQAKALEHLADLWEPLPAGTFAQAGTNVSTVLLTMEAPEAEEPCEDDPDGVHSVWCGCEA
jgi:phospholipid N-methyltransferase